MNLCSEAIRTGIGSPRGDRRVLSRNPGAGGISAHCSATQEDSSGLSISSQKRIHPTVVTLGDARIGFQLGGIRSAPEEYELIERYVWRRHLNSARPLNLLPIDIRSSEGRDDLEQAGELYFPARCRDEP